MRKGRFNSVAEKRAFLRERKRERRLAKDALGNLQADSKDYTAKRGGSNLRRIHQGGLPQ